MGDNIKNFIQLYKNNIILNKFRLSCICICSCEWETYKRKLILLQLSENQMSKAPQKMLNPSADCRLFMQQRASNLRRLR